MQQLTIAGTVGKDAVLRNTQGGDSVLSFSLVVDNGKDREGNKRDGTWFDCSVWGKRASSLEQYITKGSKLVITGRPTAREHNGKVYLGCSVNELSFMGGGQDRNQGGGYTSSNGDQTKFSSGSAGASPARDMDDEIPF